jgi:hypothetical protein
LIRAALIALACMVSPVVAQAANPPPPTATPVTTADYGYLLGQGYEIKTVSVFSASDSTRLSGAIQSADTILITLQKGGSSATCWVVFSAWNGQAMTGNTPCNLLH